MQQVGIRTDRLLGRAGPLLRDRGVALVAHGHVLRVLAARWLRLEPTDGRLSRLDTGTISTLAPSKASPVILAWNVLPTAAPRPAML